MKNINLKILNESEPNVLQYLPYGVTTLEMKIQGDKNEAEGFIYPKNRTDGMNNFHMGYADDNMDFLVIWGAGKRNGLRVNKENVDGRLFLQILHRGKDITSPTISLCHTELPAPIKIKLVPMVKDANVVKTNLTQEGESCTISFTGNEMPTYYSRWFPPRPSEGKGIRYCGVNTPSITIKFKVKKEEFSTNVNSDIDICLGKEKIAQVTGDWNYSLPHAELFAVFENSDFFVLRLWLYWIHENYSRSILRGGNALLDVINRPDDERTRRGLWESFDIESPDIERFDFLIDMNKKKISWVGTDLHYQEYWYMPKDIEFVKARIANDVETVVQVIRNLKHRFNPPENYDPMEILKKILRNENAEKLEGKGVPDIKEYLVSNLEDNGKVTYRAEGITRKHVPYIENAEIISKLVSSVVTN